MSNSNTYHGSWFVITILVIFCFCNFRSAFNQLYFKILLAITIAECVIKAKCFRSLEDGIHIIKSGGLRINGAQCTNPEDVLILGQHILINNMTVIRVGKYFKI